MVFAKLALRLAPAEWWEALYTVPTDAVVLNFITNYYEHYDNNGQKDFKASPRGRVLRATPVLAAAPCREGAAIEALQRPALLGAGARAPVESPHLFPGSMLCQGAENLRSLCLCLPGC